MDNPKDISLNISDLKLFNADNYLVFIYKKTQALINAIYLVTNLFPEAEPLKWAIRGKAVSLLEDILSLPTKTFSERKNVLARFTAKVLEIISLCEISSASALMSAMNFRILQKEFENLIDLIEKHEEPYQGGSNFVLDEALFKIPEQLAVSDKKPQSSVVKGQLAKSVYKGHSTIKDKSERQYNILNILKDKKELNIKEIGQLLTDCSEKTLQRELQRMVSIGLLRKMGERRWSRYSVI
jgi:hypothetical protein